jgi:hypothetical protein
VLNCLATKLLRTNFSPKLFANNLFTRRQIFLRKATGKDYEGYLDEKSGKVGLISVRYLSTVAKIADKAGTAHARLVAPKVVRTGKGFAALRALERLVQGGNIVGVLLEVRELRIHDILVWIRIRMRNSRSMPLTNGSGSGFGSGSFYFHP